MGFVESTRQNIRSAGRVDYAAGQSSLISLPRVGYLARAHIIVNGTMTCTPGSGTATLSEKAPWNLFSRIRYEIGSGTTLFNTSGWGAYLVDLRSKLGYLPSNDGGMSSSFATEVYNVAASSGANDWDFAVTVPITPNERDILGLILLQGEGTVTQFNLEWKTAGGATHEFPIVLTGNATATFEGTAKVYIETFTVPLALENQPPLDRVFQTLETVSPLYSVGENAVKFMEENTYLRLIHSVEINGRLNTADVESMRLRYNITDVPYELDLDAILYLERRRYTRDMPKGVFVHEFFDQGYPNYGGDRDLVAAEGLAELESIINVGSGASLGSNNNVVRTIQQQVVRVASPPAAPGSAGVVS